MKRYWGLVLILLLLSLVARAGGNSFNGGSSGLKANSTSIASGTNTRCLFDDNGVLGEDAGCTYNKATGILTLGGGLALNGGQAAIPSGTVSAPGLSWASSLSSGWFIGSQFTFSYVGAQLLSFDTTGIRVGSAKRFGWSSTTSPDTGSADTELYRAAAASIQMGADAASPVAQTFKGPNGSGTNIAGGNLTLAAGQPTGTGIGGDLIQQTAPSSTTGSSLDPYGDRERLLAKYTTLTEATATAFARVAVPSGTVAGGQVVVSVEANDGTDFQARTLRAGWSAVNKAGTITAGIDTPDEAVAVSVGTLTCTLTAVDATGNNMDLKANCTSSLTQTVLRANAYVTKNFGTGAISAQ